MYKFRMYTLIFALFSFFITDSVVSQITWTRTFGGPFSNDEAYSSIQTIDRNFVVVGDSGGGSVNIVAKYSQTGEMLWKKRFMLNEPMGWSAAEDLFGNLFFNAGFGIAKMDSDGNVLWRKYFHDTASAMYIKLTKDKQKLICYGYNNISLSDTSGNLIWYHQLNDSFFISYLVNDLTEISSYFYFTGIKEYPNGYRGFIWKYDSSGNLVWSKYYNQSDLIYSIAGNSENSFIVAGMKNYYLYTAKLDINGIPLWERNYIADSITVGNSICKAGNNRFVIASNSVFVHGKCLVIDSTGNILVNKNHSYGIRDWVNYTNVIASDDSGFVFTGYIEFNESGPVDWLVVKTDKHGNTTPIGINQISTNVPNGFKLYQNYPNPFNPATKIKFEIPYAAGDNVFNLFFKVYDLTGREVYVINETKPAGTYEITFDGSKLTSGIYFYTLRAGEFSQTQKMILLK